MIRAPARLLHDPPPQPDAIASSELPQPGSQALGVMARAARSEILIESAYLVLDDDELASARQLRDNGVQIRALTNSLASNDVTANHAAYTRARKQMLHNGIEVYELRPDAASCAELIENRLACGPQHVLGLHAKTFVIDKQTVYIGSLNLNLRSRYLNAESGLVIDSPQLAQQVASDIQLNMKPANSWAVALDERAKVRWHGGPAAAAEDWTHEPEVGWWRRTKVRLIAMWPLEKYL
jgi:putative cardiolipin synthase